MLNILRHGAPTPLPPLVIVHGLYGSARNWGAIARRLSDTREVIAVDMRNHGESPWYDSHSYADMAADLAEVLRQLDRPADMIGHSMGGKAAMMLALTHSELLRTLVVADIAPVAYNHDQTRYIHAMRSLDPTRPMSRQEASRALAPTVPDDSIRAFLLQSLDLKAGRWRLNLDVLERFMAQITGWPEATGTFARPTLFLSGAESTYVQPAHKPAIRALFPKARFAKLAGAGHWLHAEKPRAFENSCRLFFEHAQAL